jgi:hypothetical protein
MILINRGQEPDELKALRAKKLATLRALGREPTSDDIKGYRGNEDSIANALSRAQHKKCCYCEGRLKTKFNHVEHYRPKGRATREPGSKLKHGYWWLAYTWDNLLFSCASCNSIAKNDLFPLAHGSIALQAEEAAPGSEIPLLLNPGAAINPVEHIIFILEPVNPKLGAPQWRARARNKSLVGEKTIEICQLNSQDLLENRALHFETVLQEQISAIKDALAGGQTSEIQKQYARAIGMLAPSNEYVALSYDAFRHFIPDAQLQAAIQKSWPTPDRIGR